MTPGPAPVHPLARQAAVGDLPHHRTAEFRAVFRDIQQGLRAAFRTAGPVATLACSGTGAVEAALANLFAPGESVVVVAGGKFGHRWAEVATAYGLQVHELRLAPGAPLAPERLADTVAAQGPAAGLVLTASETSTGAALDVRGLVEGARAAVPDLIVVVDAITAVGALPIETDLWQLDAVCGGSQKAFMVPPGLGFVACSPRGWQRVTEPRPRPRFYFDLRRYREAAARDQTPFTPATGLMLQLRAALAAVAEAGGIEALERNAQRLAAATRAAAAALSLELLAPACPSPAVTAILAPEPGGAPAIVAALRDCYGLQVAGGQGPLKPDLFRIGHLGYIDEIDLLGTLAALEAVLAERGVAVQPGAAVAAARAALRAGDAE